MKLAEALQLRADTQKKIAQLQSRIVMNVTVQEQEEPAEDPKELIRELEESLKLLEKLMADINRTNCLTKTEKGTLTELIARKDCLVKQIESYHSFLAAASNLSARATRTEIKIVSTIPVKEYQKKCDALSKELRELDTLMQYTNWITEITE